MISPLCPVSSATSASAVVCASGCCFTPSFSLPFGHVHAYPSNPPVGFRSSTCILPPGPVRTTTPPYACFVVFGLTFHVGSTCAPPLPA